VLLIKPYLGCNLSCKYCYETQLRGLEKPEMDYNLDMILSEMDKCKDGQMTLHGGEPLCLPKKDVEKIFAKMFAVSNKSSIQTNGINIDDEYIDMFKRFNTNVGISFDGPGELSSLRMSNDNSIKISETLYKLSKNKINTSLIIVLSSSNADSPAKIKKLKTWLLELSAMNISGRINPCNGSKYELLENQLTESYMELADFCMKNNLRWGPFNDIVSRLKGESAVCVFMGCDIFHTDSATVLLGNGSITNCMRSNKDSILLRYPAKSNIRDEILQETSQECGGCKGCKFFYACKGGCPSSAEDWRDRTPLCGTWKKLFEYFSNMLEFCNIKLEENKPKSCAKEYAVGGRHGDIPHGDHTDHGDSGRK
jgi:uncharacterized protein